MSQAGLIAELQALQFVNYCLLSSDVLWLYDFVLTVPSEINVIWKQKWTAVTFLYFVTRYFFFGGVLLDLGTSYFPAADGKLCGLFKILGVVLNISSALASDCLFALRILAIYSTLPLAALPIFCITIAAAILGFLADLVYSTSAWSSQDGCIELFRNLVLYKKLSSAEGSLLFAVDLIVFILTLLKTCWAILEGRRLKMSHGISYYLLRDGTIYFVPVNVCLLTSLIAGWVSDNPYAQILGYFSPPAC